MISRHINFSLLHHNTFGIDVNAAYFYEYETVDELKTILSDGSLLRPLMHIGAGSNLLFLNDFKGTILHSRMKRIDILQEDENSVTLKVASGVVWDDFVSHCVKQGWYGVENLSVIPGEVGASAVQNIGAYGVEAKDLITEVYTLGPEGNEVRFSNKDCRFAYRYSIFKQPDHKYIVTHVCYKLSKLPSYKLDYGALRSELPVPFSLEDVRKAIIRIRDSKLPDPGQWGNAGSFFMNPVVTAEVFQQVKNKYPDMPFYEMGEGRIKIPAGWLIEQCGWKGQSLGAAGVYEKQALVLINKGGATGQDILNLSAAVCQDVKRKFGIGIHPEVRIID